MPRSSKKYVIPPAFAKHLIYYRPSYRSAVGRLNEEDQILHEGNLVQGEDDLEARGCHLGQNQQIDGDRVDLQVSPLVVANYLRNQKNN